MEESSSSGATSDPEENSTSAGSEESSGSGSASSDTGSDSTSEPSGDFQPCPTNGDPCVILPFGDSITVGLGYAGGYRVKLFELAVNDDKNITFVGHSTAQDAGGPNGPNTVAGKPFPRDHEGHSGWTILSGNNAQGIYDRVPSPALDDDPHIVLLHIGTNDASRGVGANMLPNLGQLLDKVIETVPDALIVVAQIIPLPGNQAITTYNAGIPDLVEGLAAEGKHVIYADLNTGFENTDLGDGVHPNQGGYEKMADDWYTAIKDYLPAAQ